MHSTILKRQLYGCSSYQKVNGIITMTFV